MAPVFEGHLSAKGRSFCIVASRFNRVYTQQLLDGAIDCLLRHGAEEASIDTFWVPGTFEIPVTARKLALKKTYDAIICLGALIRGETNHYDHLATQVNRGIAEISMISETPVANGILTCDSMEQAAARASSKMGNKGWDAAQSAVEMADLFSRMHG